MLKVLGKNEKWLGGNMEEGLGGGFVINLLKQGLFDYRNRDDLVLYITDR